MHEKNEDRDDLSSFFAGCQDTIKTHLCRSKIQKLNAMRQHIRVLQRMALRLSG